MIAISALTFPSGARAADVASGERVDARRFASDLVGGDQTGGAVRSMAARSVTPGSIPCCLRSVVTCPR